MSGVPISSGFGAGQAGFDVAHGVVAETADQTAAETRQAAGGGRGSAACTADEVERIGVVLALGDAVAGEHQHLVAIDHDAGRAARPMME